MSLGQDTGFLKMFSSLIFTDFISEFFLKNLCLNVSNVITTLVKKYDLCVHGIRYIFSRVVFCAESKSDRCLFPALEAFEIFSVKFSKNLKSYNKRV